MSKVKSTQEAYVCTVLILRPISYYPPLVGILYCQKLTEKRRKNTLEQIQNDTFNIQHLTYIVGHRSDPFPSYQNHRSE